MKTVPEEWAMVMMVMAMMSVVVVMMMMRRMTARNEWAACERRTGLYDDDQAQKGREQLAEHE
ncbi:hypothetical protein Pan44_37570 [Caulifigura coniformis]|uniref:Uncharacterized protein n=1 Tax=Caulifigura coniformis TaxID=2527983 RepID=A0A517SHW4_9PLAN|nr:hypothetical protein Pan44_37570 [Caulifigura coniformis]